MSNPFFKDGDQLAYVVWYDDNDPYEDNFQCIDAIFSSWDEAENYLKDRKKEEIQWSWVYSDGLSVKVKEPKWTDEYHDSDYDPEWTIEIWNMTTGYRVLYDNEHIFLVEEK